LIGPKALDTCGIEWVTGNPTGAKSTEELARLQELPAVREFRDRKLTSLCIEGTKEKTA